MAKSVFVLIKHGKSFSTSAVRLDNHASTSRLKQPREAVESSTVRGNPQTNHMRLKASQRDLVIDVLGASTTKREAKSYLTRFQARNSEKQEHARKTSLSGYNHVNLGNLFLLTTGDKRRGSTEERSLRLTEPRHVAIVLLKRPESISDDILHGITRTLSHLTQLGMRCIVVLDVKEDPGTRNEGPTLQSHRQLLFSQADRIVQDLETHLNQRARRIDYLFGSTSGTNPSAQAPIVKNLNLLLQCLDTENIPVVLPIWFDSSLNCRRLSSEHAMESLSRALTGTIDGTIMQHPNIEHAGMSQSTGSESCFVDRIIILDSHGGIPVQESSDKVHTFVNLEQEYESIAAKLDLHSLRDTSEDARGLQAEKAAALEHHQNLTIAQRTLRYLPPKSSALITSPEAVAKSEYSYADTAISTVGTRAQKNILIHNILTDKPIRSSSLPLSRLSESSNIPIRDATKISATFLKRGMPITLIPEPGHSIWKRPLHASRLLSLSDPRLNIARLVHLIEDSFGRPLDQKHYFERIAPRLCGIIIAGAYEGGAILTWEKPQSVAEGDISRYVPYLDKFAVLKRSQGSGGVADVVFSAMVRDCFPNGVCWRSRSDNPVNKWYFERATGTTRLRPSKPSEQSWTMFWTTEGVEGQRLRDYEEVCSGIQSSWADNKTRFD